jgi:predicted nucleic acid-binding protein
MPLAVFDTTFLALLTDGLAAAPSPPPGTQDTARERLDYLLETLDDERTSIVVPTPVLAELLSFERVSFEGALRILKQLDRIRIEAFGERAALECAEMLRRTGRGSGPKTKVKFDHQIVAIAKVVGADVVYSDDKGVQALCERMSLPCFGVWTLPPRPVDPQSSLSFEAPQQ